MAAQMANYLAVFLSGISVEGICGNGSFNSMKLR